MSDVIDRAEAVKKLQRREAWRRRLPLLPALLFTIVVTQVPFVLSLYFSFTKWEIFKTDPRRWIGFENYQNLWDNRFFRDAAWNTVVMTVSSVLLSVILGTLLALLLDRKFFGQGFIRTLLITPFLVMPVVAGVVWRSQMFNFNFGVLNWVLDTLGMDRIAFTSQYPLGSIVAVLVWQWTPFMMLIILAGLQGQSDSVLEAARVDGASNSAIFFQITLPHLRRYLELGVLLGSIYLIQVFDHIVTIGAGPNSTNLPFFIQRAIGTGGRFGQGSAYSVVVVIASIIIATFGLRVLSGLLEGEDA